MAMEAVRELTPYQLKLLLLERKHAFFDPMTQAVTLEEADEEVNGELVDYPRSPCVSRDEGTRLLRLQRESKKPIT